MNSEIQQLSAELRRIQSENIELYAKLANLRKEKSQLQQPKEEEESNNDFKNQIEAIMNQQKIESARRTSSQKQLQSIIDELKQIHIEIDEQNSTIQNNLLPILNEEEELTNQFYQDILEKCKTKPKSSIFDHHKIENLVSQLSKKTKEYFESQDEIEKLTRLIAINENPVPDSSKVNSYFEDYHLSIQRFDKSHTRKRGMFKFDNM